MSAPFYVAQRQVGTVNEIVPVYLQSTTSPFFGIQNVTISSGVSASWFRSDATGATSFAIISTAALGSYSSGNWTQVNSTVAPGWYELGIPSAAFSSGRWVSLIVFSSSNAWSPQPLFYELTKTDNQTYVSSQTLSTAICRIYSSPIVTTFAGIQTADVSTVFGSNFVTTAAGMLAVGRVGVSSFGLDVGVSSMNTGLSVGVSTFNSRVGVSSFGIDVGVSSFNTGLQVGVSSFSSRVGVSSFNLPVGVSSFDVGLQVGVSSFGVAVGVSSFNTGLQVGVSTFSSRVGVSSFGLAVGVSSMQDKSDYGVSSVTGLNTSLLDASVASRLATAGYTAPDNTNIANIQANTSSLTYTVPGVLDANIQYVNGTEVKGTGTVADPWNPV